MTLYFNPNGTVKPDLFKVALSTLTEDTIFQLTGVKSSYITDADNKPTDAVKSVTYTIYVQDFMAQINVKVDSTVPVITPEELNAALSAGKEIFVEIPTAETYIRPYAMSYGAFSCTIKAPYVKLS